MLHILLIDDHAIVRSTTSWWRGTDGRASGEWLMADNKKLSVISN